jgi:hypothetical protein
MWSMREREISIELNRALQNGHTILRHAALSTEAGVPRTQRNQSVIGFASIALEHQSSILRLIATGDHDGTAMALLRPMVETVARVMWVYSCASEKDIIDIFNGSFKFPSFGRMTDNVEKRLKKPGFFGMPAGLWALLNGFTHGGTEQLARRFDHNGEYSPQYPDEELIGCIELSSFCTATIGSFILFISGQTDFGRIQALAAKLFL